eukprot:TRINITY_DN94639_c0_g1_i1.p1 TRINITY_DN94639_c0_g1~~TRINITY_DN94639_c0_g1_i1.p1  ORF type:complete len:395 (+),score=34.99 TRINITY_DN94639_c0_g1_i1:78-1187(+)
MAATNNNAVPIAVGITLWYLTSFGTLLLNKYLLATRHVQPNSLAVIQMVSTAIYGALKTLRPGDISRLCKEASEILSGGGRRESSKEAGDVELQLDGEDQKTGCGNGKGVHLDRWRRGFVQMGFVGMMRFATVVLGLVSLKNVAASFTETIKASAPFFTVIIAYFMIGEKTSGIVMLSLVPVATGLVMVSSTELSFNVIGFSAAVATNVIECVQNVFSKRLLASEYTASQLQFYTSLTALVLQAPIFIYSYASTPPEEQEPLRDFEVVANATVSNNIQYRPPETMDKQLIFLLWIDGVLYHAQSVVAYVVMSYLSPVTVSVVNTLKRALLIVISVQVFQNHLTPITWVGTGVCLLGAAAYNWARQLGSK